MTTTTLTTPDTAQAPQHDHKGCTERNRRYMDAWLQIIRSYEHFHAQVAALLQARGLTVAQFEVLSTLASVDCGNQQELADRLRMTKGNLVGLIDRLTDRGWVEREQVPGDRRVNRVKITETGRAFIHAVLPEQAKVVETMLSGLNDDEVETVKTLLKKAAARVVDPSADNDPNPA
jgi:DNA-binding MarR family transcriptional regulator